MLNLEFSDADFNSTVNALFIPVADLPGVNAAELAAGESTANKEAKAILGLWNQLFNIASPAAFGRLGLTVTKSTPAGGGSADLVNLTFSSTAQRLVNLASNSIAVVPVPTAGANSGVGDFALTDIFPGAAKVAAAAATGGAGVAIPWTLIEAFGGAAYAGADIAAGNDNRMELFALLESIANGATPRAADAESAIITRTLSAPASATIPVNYYQAADPVAGVVQADLAKLGLLSRTTALTIQVALNQTTQVFEVNVI